MMVDGFILKAANNCANGKCGTCVLLNLNDCQAQIAKELLRLSNENINLTCENVELKRKCENFEQCGMGDKFSTLLMNIMLQAEAHEQYFNHFDLDDLAAVFG